MKIRSAVPENGCLVFLWRMEKTKKNKRNICKTYTHPPHRRLRKLYRQLLHKIKNLSYLIRIWCLKSEATDRWDFCSRGAQLRLSRVFRPTEHVACTPRQRVLSTRAVIFPARPGDRPPSVSTLRLPCRTTAGASRPGWPVKLTTQPNKRILLHDGWLGSIAHALWFLEI